MKHRDILYIITAIMLLLFVLVSMPSSAQITVYPCDITQFGTYCLNPHTNPMLGYLPIDTVISFRNPEIPTNNPEHTDIGIISGYFWDINEQVYKYLVITNPFDPLSEFPLMRRDIVALDEVLNAFD